MLTGEFTALGVTRMLEAMKKAAPKARFYQASSSEMFGKVVETPQRETTPFYPRSPYGVAKVYGHWITVNYRESYGLYAVSGILFNHESPRRGLEFVTRKVTDGVARIKLGLANEAAARQPRRAARLGLRRRLRRRDVADAAAGRAGRLRRSAPGDTCRCASSARWRSRASASTISDYVKQDPTFFRPAEVDLLVADPSKAQRALGWDADGRPSSSSSQMMVDADLERHARASA